MLITRAGWALAGTPVALDGQAGGPVHAGDDVGVEAAAFAERADRQHLDVAGPTLAMPCALSVAAPIRPAVCVPCQELVGLVATVRAVQPGTLAATSAWVTKSPGSDGVGVAAALSSRS